MYIYVGSIATNQETNINIRTKIERNHFKSELKLTQVEVLLILQVLH